MSAEPSPNLSRKITGEGLEAFEEFYFVAFLQGYVGLLPVHLAALHRAAATLFAHEVRGADLEDRDLEELLDRDSNRILARLLSHPQQHLAPLFVHERPLLVAA